MDRYSLRERIFPFLSMENNNTSVISVQRAYHKEFEYEKTFLQQQSKGNKQVW